MLCSCCNQVIIEGQHGLECGYDLEHKPVCYSCCAVQDKKQMDDTGKIYLYLTGNMVVNGRYNPDVATLKITNWPNSLKFQPMTIKRYWNVVGGNAYRVYHVTFLDHNRKRWYGIMKGDNTELLMCKRYKTPS